MKAFLLFGLAVAVPGLMLAAGEPTVVGGEPATDGVQPAPLALTPMMVEIMAAIEATRADVADLTDQVSGVGDQAATVELQRDIAQRKFAGRLAVMRIQLRYAEQEGRTDHAAALAETIARMTAPPRTGQSQPRPAPVRP